MTIPELLKFLSAGPDSFLLVGLATLPDMDYNAYSDKHTLGGYFRQSTPSLPAMQRCAKAIIQMMIPGSIPMAFREGWLDVIGTASLDGKYRITKKSLVACALNDAFNSNTIRRVTGGCTVVDIKVSYQHDSTTNLFRRWSANVLGYVWCVVVALPTQTRMQWLLCALFGVAAALCAHIIRDIGYYRLADDGDIRTIPDTVLGVSRSDRIIAKIDLSSLPRPEVHRADSLRTSQAYAMHNGTGFGAIKLLGAACVICHAAVASSGDSWCRWGLAILHLISLFVERSRPHITRVSASGCASARVERMTYHDITLVACVDAATSTEQLTGVTCAMFDPSLRRGRELEWLIYFWRGLRKQIKKEALENTFDVNTSFPRGYKVQMASKWVEGKVKFSTI
jgi:hypothetical protein